MITSQTIKVFLFFVFISAGSACSLNTALNSIEGPGIIAGRGMVVSAHQESSRIGIGILKKGGNAIDAAVATEFALAVCYPEAGNIGGGGFMVVRTKDGKSEVIDYREKAPLIASKDMFLDKEGNVREGISTTTHLASGVPGTVDGMIRAHSKYGILAFEDVIQPAVDLAETGFPVTRIQAASFNENRNKFIERNSHTPAFVKDLPWKEGDTLRQIELGATLKRIRDLGRNGFYSGQTAEYIIREMTRGNGIITQNDLAVYSSLSREPLQTDYRGYRILSVPPPSSGGIILFQLLGMLEPYPVDQWEFHSPSSIHFIAEAERRAFADRAQYLGDPEFYEIPVTQLLNRNYLKSRMKSFNESGASSSSDISHGFPAGSESDETTHYSVVDQEGNAVAATTTLNGSFGNGIVVEGAGFLLNNQMDDFSLKPGFPNIYGLSGGEANSIQAGKRMLSSMTPVIVENKEKLFMVLGSPGGSTIPTSVFQVIINVIDYGMNIQSAVDAGRFHHQWFPDAISYERTAFDSNCIQILEHLGHEMIIRPAIGRINAIHILPYNKKAAGADKRGNNSACGY